MLALFLVTNSIYLFDILPYVANHLLFEAILNPTLLIALAVCCWHARALRVDPARQSPMTYFEFRQVVSSMEGDFQIDFIRGGQPHTVQKRDAEGEDAELFAPHPWWLRKFLAFRRLPDPDQPMPCKW